jgi:hypothetical protein
MGTIGISPTIHAMAKAAYDASRSKKGETETIKRIVEAIKPGCYVLVEVGVDQAIIAAHQRKREIEGFAAAAKLKG